MVSDALDAIERDALKSLSAESIALVSIATSLDRIAWAVGIIAARVESWDKLGSVEVSIRQGSMTAHNVPTGNKTNPPTPQNQGRGAI